MNFERLARGAQDHIEAQRKQPENRNRQDLLAIRTRRVQDFVEKNDVRNKLRRAAKALKLTIRVRGNANQDVDYVFTWSSSTGTITPAHFIVSISPRSGEIKEGEDNVTTRLIHSQQESIIDDYTNRIRRVIPNSIFGDEEQLTDELLKAYKLPIAPAFRDFG